MTGEFPEALDSNRLFLELNRLLCNKGRGWGVSPLVVLGRKVTE